MNFTKNFPRADLLVTNTGLDNEPDPIADSKLLYLATYILQPFRNKNGITVVNSAFRSEAVEKVVAKKGYEWWLEKKGILADAESWQMYLAGKQHPKGEAADIFPKETDIDKAFKWLVTESGIVYGQAILETHTRPHGKKTKKVRWIHVSLPRVGKTNRVPMTYENGVYKLYQEV